MKADKLGPILRPLFKKVKELFKELVQGEAVLGFRKGPVGKLEDIKSILWDKAFGCRVKVDNVSENALFIIMEKNGGIFLSGKLLLLPQSNIDALVKKGEVNESVLDAQKEIFNMLVGKLNDVLREKVQKDIHLVMEDNFIVDEKDLSFFPADEEYVTYTANVKLVGPITFSIGIIFNKELANLIIKHISDEEEEEEIEEIEQGDESNEEVEEELSQEETEEKEELTTFINLKSVSKDAVPPSYMDYIIEEDFPVAQLGTSLWNAANKMKEYEVDYIILVDGLKFIGILTMADIRKGLSPFLEEPFKEYCREQDLATKNFQIEWFLENNITPVSYNASLEEVLAHYLKQNFPYLPVCKNGRIVGVITHVKLVQYLASLLYENASQDEKSDREVVTNTAS